MRRPICIPSSLHGTLRPLEPSIRYETKQIISTVHLSLPPVHELFELLGSMTTTRQTPEHTANKRVHKFPKSENGVFVGAIAPVYSLSLVLPKQYCIPDSRDWGGQSSFALCSLPVLCSVINFFCHREARTPPWSGNEKFKSSSPYKMLLVSGHHYYERRSWKIQASSGHPIRAVYLPNGGFSARYIPP